MSAAITLPPIMTYGRISLLGLGTMRLPLRDAADQTSIDEEKAQGDMPMPTA